MPAKYTLIPLPLDATDPGAQGSTFDVFMQAHLEFPAGGYSSAQIRAAAENHPHLSGTGQTRLIGRAMKFSAWRANGNRLDQSRAIELTLEYIGSTSLAEMKENLLAYLLTHASCTAAKQEHDPRFDRLSKDHFLDVGKAHDELKAIHRSLQKTAISSLGNLMPASLLERSDELSLWINSGVQAALLEALYLGRGVAHTTLSSLGLRNNLDFLRTAVEKINKRMLVDQGANTATRDNSLSLITPQGTTAVTEDDPNVAINAALMNRLLAESCGLITSWKATASHALSGDYVLYMDAIPGEGANVEVLRKPVAFRRKTHTHPLAFRDVGSDSTTHGGLAMLTAPDGEPRYRAVCVDAEGNLVKHLIAQANNTLAELGKEDHKPFGEFNEELDTRPPDLLGDQQFGFSEHETAGVTFSAPVEDLVRADGLGGTPADREARLPCLFHEDLWIGYRLDVAGQGVGFTSTHAQTQKLTFRSGTTVSGRVEDYISREQPDDSQRQHSSTEISTYAGFGTAQMRDYLRFLGHPPVPPSGKNPPFRTEVVAYEQAQKLRFGETYQYRFRTVFAGGVSVEVDASALSQLAPQYRQAFPFFRARAFRPGLAVDSAEGNGDAAVEGRAFYLSKDAPERRLTIVPMPIDVETSRFHGMFLSNEDDPSDSAHRAHVIDAQKFFSKPPKSLDYFCDPDVTGVRVRLRYLNGDERSTESTFVFHNAHCELTRHLELGPIDLPFGEAGGWKNFKGVELVFKTTAGDIPGLRSVGRRRAEIKIPPAGEMEVCLEPIVDPRVLAKSAAFISSSVDLLGPQLGIEAQASTWVPTAAVARQMIKVHHAVPTPKAVPRMVRSLTDRKVENGRVLLSAARDADSANAQLLGRLELDAASTGEVRLEATWSDIVDDPAQPSYFLTRANAVGKPRSLVFSKYRVPRASGTMFARFLYSPGGGVSSTLANFRIGQTKFGFVDQFRTQCAENKVFLETADGTVADSSPAGLIDFKDSRRKIAGITAVAATRFRKQFNGSAVDSRSKSAEVDVQSCLRVPSPQVSHILPLRRLDTHSENDAHTERALYGFRIYVYRPWFVSGPGERLAIACRIGDPPGVPQASLDKRVTQWGEDPVERAGLEVSRRAPRASDFRAIVPPPSRTKPAFDERLYPAGEDAEASIFRDNVLIPADSDAAELRVSVASFALRWDDEQRLWYCDVRVQNPFFGWCGIALYRHQPHSTEGRELSAIADWAYAAVLHGETVSWIARGNKIHLTVGPVFDEELSFDLDSLEYTNGVSEQVKKSSSVAMQRYRVERAYYFECQVRRPASDWSLIKRRFGHIVASIGLNAIEDK